MIKALPDGAVDHANVQMVKRFVALNFTQRSFEPDLAAESTVITVPLKSKSRFKDRTAIKPFNMRTSVPET